MSLLSDCRLLVDPPAPGAWNMAVDEALLESAAGSQTSTLRFYRWNEPTLSLGYFQLHTDRATHSPSSGCPLVRRPSGGGAIVHDEEWTYSLTVPADIPLGRRPDDLYHAVHQALVDALQEMGVGIGLCSGFHMLGWLLRKWAADASLWNDPASSSPEPFLCFKRRCEGDVLLDKWKILGSAQRRPRGALLQHGSLLLKASRAAPELPGLFDLLSSRVEPDELLAAWQDRLSTRLGVRLQHGALSNAERGRAEKIERAKYATETWNKKR